MARKNNKSLAEELRSAAYVWLGNTNIDNTYVLLANFNKQTHEVIVEVTDDNIILKASKETNSLSQEIFTILYEINPAWKKKEIGKINTPALPKGLAITSDWNQTFYDKEIKPLKETTVVPFLDSLGVNMTMYEYTKLSVDNSHSLKPEYVLKGYENYSEELLSYIADTSKYKDYKMTKESIYRMLDMGCYRGLIAAGPAGTGKSTDPLIYCAKKEIPVIVFQCTPGTDEDVLLGKWQPKEGEGNSKFLELINTLTTKLSVLSKEEMLDIVKTYEVMLNDSINNYVFQPGPLSLGVIYDCFVVINEANYMPSANFSTLNSLMDDNAQLLLPNGRVIKRGNNFRLILTVNPGYRGTSMFNEATLNRFVTAYYEPVTKKEIINRLKVESDYKNNKVLDVIAEQFDKLRDIYDSKNMETEITYRNINYFLRMLLMAPEESMEEQFDIAFIDSTHFELDDVSVKDLKDIRKEMLKDIKAVLSEGTEEVTESSWSCSPQVDIEDLTSQIGDDGSFLDVNEEAE